MISDNSEKLGLSSSLVRTCFSPREIWPLGYQSFFMLNSVEHEILNAYTYKNIKKFSFLGSNKPRMLFFPLINVKIYKQKEFYAQFS